jgi:hypothetical protein
VIAISAVISTVVEQLGSENFMHRRLLWRMAVISALWLDLAIVGCATETVKPTFPTASGLPQPDRILVYDFAVTPGEAALQGVVGSGLESQGAQSAEDIRVGRALGKAVSENLVSELRSRGIDALAAATAAAPGETTALIRGRFMRSGPSGNYVVGFALGAGEARARIQIFQGAGLDRRLVSEAESVSPSSLKPGATAGVAVEADAKRIAQALAERVAAYYRSQGWLR